MRLWESWPLQRLRSAEACFKDKSAQPAADETLALARRGERVQFVAFIGIMVVVMPLLTVSMIWPILSRVEGGLVPTLLFPVLPVVQFTCTMYCSRAVILSPFFHQILESDVEVMR